MNSRVLFESGRYVACLTRAGLIVQSIRTNTGRRMAVDHPQFADYVDGFDTAIDRTEGDDLCRALLRS